MNHLLLFCLYQKLTVVFIGSIYNLNITREKKQLLIILQSPVQTTQFLLWERKLTTKKKQKNSDIYKQHCKQVNAFVETFVPFFHVKYVNVSLVFEREQCMNTMNEGKKVSWLLIKRSYFPPFSFFNNFMISSKRGLLDGFSSQHCFISS